MAFQDFQMAPPTDAPLARTTARRVEAAPRPARARIVQAAAPKRDYARLAAFVLLALVIIAAGIRAGTATESLAIGIIAADFAFLIIAAAWSAVTGRRRGR
jgi:hypothetical protein